MNRKFNFVPGHYYHLCNWGVDQRKIFSDVYDYHRFLKLLYLCNSDQPLNFNQLATINLKKLFAVSRGNKLVAIKAYCLLPNHFHILVKENEKGGISKFMSRLATAYSMYFNYKYGRRGKLYEGPFKARPISSVAVLDELINFVHSEPLTLLSEKNNLVDLETQATIDYLKNYTFSSLADYLGVKRLQSAIIDIAKSKNSINRRELRQLLERVRAAS